MVRLNFLLPKVQKTTIKCQNEVVKNVKGLKEVYGIGFIKMDEQHVEIIEAMSEYLHNNIQGVTLMTEGLKKTTTLKILGDNEF